VKVRLHRARGYLRRELYRAVGHEFKDVFAFDGSRCDRIVESVFARLSSL
jgi:RNA polymerase sigma-70 factor (ECF subfamily)